MTYHDCFYFMYFFIFCTLAYDFIDETLSIFRELNSLLLAALLTNCSSPLENREKLYLLGVGYYRTGKFPRSGQLADQCLEVCSSLSVLDNLQLAAISLSSSAYSFPSGRFGAFDLFTVSVGVAVVYH